MLNSKHGGHVVAASTPEAEAAARKMGYQTVKSPPKGTPFHYLLPQLASQPGSHIPGDPAKVTKDLKDLGKAMIDNAAAAATDPAVKVNSTIPAVYTYWGQFIDHDMTANTDRDSPVSDITKEPLTPVKPDVVTKDLRNLRRPTFDLDSVYGNGPGLDPHYHRPDPGPDDAVFYDGIRMHVGRNDISPGIPGIRIPPADDLARDLPRVFQMQADGIITADEVPADLRGPEGETRPLIGDLRNDENLIVAQFHLAVLRFHNKVVDAIEADPQAFGLAPGAGDNDRFMAAQRLVRYHYQWLVVNDYLKTVTLPGVVDRILVGGTQHYEPLPDGELFAPLEYSVAAFRFGHTMVRGGYDHNRNFGAPASPDVTPVQRFAGFDDLFLFTGNGHIIDTGDITKSTRRPFRGLKTLPFNWIIEWDRMTNKADPNEAHFARGIDTRLVPPILNMVNEGTAAGIQDDAVPANKPLRQLLRSLATRNLLRGYLLSIPTGQAVAAAMGVQPLSRSELRRNNSDAVNQALQNGGFLEHTPLWYYVLKEAEVRANGNSLGELGSRIVAETQIGIMRGDPSSYLNDGSGGWDPSKGVQLPDGGGPIVTIRDFFAFADLAA
jgi:hypothetical protein